MRDSLCPPTETPYSNDTILSTIQTRNFLAQTRTVVIYLAQLTINILSLISLCNTITALQLSRQQYRLLLLLILITSLPYVLATKRSRRNTHQYGSQEWAVTIIINFFYKYWYRRSFHKKKSNTLNTLHTPPPTPPMKQTYLRIMTTNIQRGIHQPSKYMEMVDLTLEVNPSIHILTETGPADADILKHLTTHMAESDLESKTDRERMTRDHLTHFPYHITTSTPSPENKAIGVALLTHPNWIPRKLGKPHKHPNGRWLRQSYRGPQGIITIYGVYCRVNPTEANGGDQEWRDILSDVSTFHAKGHAIIVAGDMNMSFNVPHHRSGNDKPNHAHQQVLLEEALHRFDLVDTFLTLYPTATYKTWTNKHGDWSSPDHILISAPCSKS